MKQNNTINEILNQIKKELVESELTAHDLRVALEIINKYKDKE